MIARRVPVIANTSRGIAVRPAHQEMASMAANIVRNAIVLFLVVATSGCGKRASRTADARSRPFLSEQEIARLASEKVFFGHQSVGSNIIDGIRDVLKTDPRLKLKIVTSSDPQAVAGPALIEFKIGQNGNPRLKDEVFAVILDKGMGKQGGIVMYKYCYLDIDSSTDVGTIFDTYRGKIRMLKTKYRAVKVAHITMPLTTVESAPKAWIKSKLGRVTARDLTVKRNQFNTLLKQTYAGVDPVFDLAEVESTHRDGSRSYFMRNNAKVYTLAPEFTIDGGHLNEIGRRTAAEQFLLFLGSLPQM